MPASCITHYRSISPPQRADELPVLFNTILSTYHSDERENKSVILVFSPADILPEFFSILLTLWAWGTVGLFVG